MFIFVVEINTNLNKLAKMENLKTLTPEKFKNKLLFVGMGMTYKPKYEGDPCNHRIRAEIKNNFGTQFFIEFGTGIENNEMRIDHAIRRENKEDINNYHNLEHRNQHRKYTKENILLIVNRHFDCNFKEVIIDNHNIGSDDNICQSPE